VAQADRRAFRDGGVRSAGHGNGDQSALALRGGEIRSNDVYAWNHEDDSRTWSAPDIATYIEWWLSGQLEL
jgi:hypothetical protein